MTKQIQDAYIVAATRTPIGRSGRGYFRNTRPDDLLVAALRSARDGLDFSSLCDGLCQWVNLQDAPEQDAQPRRVQVLLEITGRRYEPVLKMTLREEWITSTRTVR